MIDRIDRRLEDLGLSREKASRLAGRSRDFVRILGRDPHKPTIPRADHLLGLARVLECSVEYLLGDQDDLGSPPRRLISGTHRLPVRYRVEAGPWHEVEDLDQAYGEHDVPVPPRFAGFVQWLEEVVGDSMDRLIQPGRLIHVIDAIDMGYQPADGDIVVVERQRAGLHERTLKQVEITGRKTLLWPRSTNPRWQSPLDVSSGLREEASEITVQVVGLVIADFRVWK